MADIRADGSEILHYDNPEFPVFCRHNYIPAGAILSNTSLHWHDEVELIYIVDGRINHRINGKYIAIGKGEGLFINSRQLHLIIPDERENCELYCLIFKPSLLGTCIIMERLAGSVTDNESLEYIKLGEDTEWHRRILFDVKEAVELSERNGGETGVFTKLFDILGAITSNIELKSVTRISSDSDQKIVKEMISFIQHNYSSDISLDKICRAGSVGKTKCAELFKKFTRMTPMDYLRCYRIEMSFDLLTETDFSITRIATEVGFAGAGYYGEIFKKKVGVTPLEYRKCDGKI